MTGIATAQPPAAGERLNRMDRMAILLDLDDYQKSEVQRIFDERREARRATRDAIRESGVRPSREEMETQRQQARENTRLQLQAVLTPEQMTKFDVLAEDQPGRGRRGRGGPRGDDASE
jgi:Spy/CpxP family protein refolding chaperone